MRIAWLRRGSQVKRGALYTANPLLPDLAGSACRWPGLPVSASKIAGGCKNRFRPLRVRGGGDGKIAPRREMKMTHGVHCASFLLCTCTTGMGREPWKTVLASVFGTFSLQHCGRDDSTRVIRGFRQVFVTCRNADFPAGTLPPQHSSFKRAKKTPTRRLAFSRAA